MQHHLCPPLPHIIMLYNDMDCTVYLFSLPSLSVFSQANSKIEQLTATNVDIPKQTRSVSRIQLPSIAVFDVSGSPLLARLFLTSGAPTSLPDLKVLKMSRCKISIFLENFLQQKTPNVSKLDLSDNPLECTCYGLAWIPKYVRDGKLSLLQEEKTICETPSHLKGIPLLLATLCPNISSPPTVPTTRSVLPTPTTSDQDLELSNETMGKYK